MLRTFFPGGYSGEVIPVPIPNTEVKLSRADGTAGETLWESRSLPGFFLMARIVSIRAITFFGLRVLKAPSLFGAFSILPRWPSSLRRRAMAPPTVRAASRGRGATFLVEACWSAPPCR